MRILELSENAWVFGCAKIVHLRSFSEFPSPIGRLGPVHFIV